MPQSSSTPHRRDPRGGLGRLSHLAALRVASCANANAGVQDDAGAEAAADRRGAVQLLVEPAADDQEHDAGSMDERRRQQVFHRRGIREQPGHVENHSVDGSKRAAFDAVDAFLCINKWRLRRVLMQANCCAAQALIPASAVS